MTQIRLMNEQMYDKCMASTFKKSYNDIRWIMENPGILSHHYKVQWKIIKTVYNDCFERIKKNSDIMKTSYQSA